MRLWRMGKCRIAGHSLQQQVLLHQIAQWCVSHPWMVGIWLVILIAHIGQKNGNGIHVAGSLHFGWVALLSQSHASAQSIGWNTQHAHGLQLHSAAKLKQRSSVQFLMKQEAESINEILNRNVCEPWRVKKWLLVMKMLRSFSMSMLNSVQWTRTPPPTCTTERRSINSLMKKWRSSLLLKRSPPTRPNRIVAFFVLSFANALQLFLVRHTVWKCEGIHT